jgi:hypothetical protein
MILNRNSFVNLVFGIGYDKVLYYDTLLSAVLLGDTYVDSGISRQYSLELAHVCCILASKLKQDYHYRDIYEGIVELDNNDIRNLEQEVCDIVRYHIPSNNILVLFVTLKEKLGIEGEFSDIFLHFVSLQISRNKFLLHYNPVPVLMGYWLLAKKQKIANLTVEYTIFRREQYFRAYCQCMAVNSETTLEEVLFAIKNLSI